MRRRSCRGTKRTSFYAVGMNSISFSSSLPQILGTTTRISNCLREMWFTVKIQGFSSVFCHFPMKRVRFASDFSDLLRDKANNNYHFRKLIFWVGCFWTNFDQFRYWLSTKIHQVDWFYQKSLISTIFITLDLDLLD